MDIADFLIPDRVLLGLRGRDKTALLKEVARLTATWTPGLDAKDIERALTAREALGSTGLGAGFALPHARIERLTAFLGVFIRTARAVDFDAIDGKPVDLVFLLLIPAEAADHVSALAAVSRRFRDADIVTKLRKASTPAAAYGLLTLH